MHRCAGNQSQAVIKCESCHYRCPNSSSTRHGGCHLDNRPILCSTSSRAPSASNRSAFVHRPPGLTNTQNGCGVDHIAEVRPAAGSTIYLSRNALDAGPRCSRYRDFLTRLRTCHAVNARGDIGEANRHASHRDGRNRVRAAVSHSTFRRGPAGAEYTPTGPTRLRHRPHPPEFVSDAHNSSRRRPSHPRRPRHRTRQGFMAATSGDGCGLPSPAPPSVPRLPIALFVLVTARWRHSQACSHRKVLRWNTIGSTSDCTRTSLIFNSTTA